MNTAPANLTAFVIGPDGPPETWDDESSIAQEDINTELPSMESLSAPIGSRFSLAQAEEDAGYIDMRDANGVLHFTDDQIKAIN